MEPICRELAGPCIHRLFRRDIRPRRKFGVVQPLPATDEAAVLERHALHRARLVAALEPGQHRGAIVSFGQRAQRCQPLPLLRQLYARVFGDLSMEILEARAMEDCIEALRRETE